MSGERTSPSPLNVGANTAVFARHRKFRECLARGTRQRIEHVGPALGIADIVEERAEGSSRQLRGGVGHHLDGRFQIRFGRDRSPDAIEQLQSLRFFLEQARRLPAGPRKVGDSFSMRAMSSRANPILTVVPVLSVYGSRPPGLLSRPAARARSGATRAAC